MIKITEKAKKQVAFESLKVGQAFTYSFEEPILGVKIRLVAGAYNFFNLTELSLDYFVTISSLVTPVEIKEVCVIS